VRAEDPANHPPEHAKVPGAKQSWAWVRRVPQCWDEVRALAIHDANAGILQRTFANTNRGYSVPAFLNYSVHLFLDV
jgi:hypothetical protein